jgi:6-phosphogluconolactonase
MEYSHLATDTGREFTAAGVTLLEGLINEAVLRKDRCVIGLSGGSTPWPVYEALGKSKKIDWSKVWLFLVDERYVSAESDDSNTRLVRETLLAHAAIPPMQCKYPSALPLEDWKNEYEETLADLLGGEWPDIVILGMGEDGHIASLFPPVADEGRGPELSVHTTTDQFAVHDRLSVTMPVLANAQSKIFLLRGEGKKNVWEEMLASDEDEERWPAKAVLSQAGCTLISQW